MYERSLVSFVDIVLSGKVELADKSTHTLRFTQLPYPRTFQKKYAPPRQSLGANPKASLLPLKLAQSTIASGRARTHYICYTKPMQVPSWFRTQVRMPRVSARMALTGVVVYLGLAVGSSILLSNDPNWARWHISYLGEGDSFSAHFFNTNMMIAGLLMAGFSIALYHYLRTSYRQARRVFIVVNFLAISACIYLIGMFPRSFGVLPHDIFGHAIYFLFLLLCVSAPWSLPGMRRWFYVVSYLFHAAMVALFVLYWTGVSESLYLAEVATFVFFIGWTVILLDQGRKP